MNAIRQYADRDVISQGHHYIRHISAMTSESLHGKSEIASDLCQERYLPDERAKALRHLHGWLSDQIKESGQ